MLEDVENGTSNLKMVDTSNQDDVKKYIKRIEEVVTVGHGKKNLSYVCEGEIIKDLLLKGNETTGFLTQQRNNIVLNGSGGRLYFEELGLGIQICLPSQLHHDISVQFQAKVPSS